jgi:hypothetical protein
LLIFYVAVYTTEIRRRKPKLGGISGDEESM